MFRTCRFTICWCTCCMIGIEPHKLPSVTKLFSLCHPNINWVWYLASFRKKCFVGISIPTSHSKWDHWSHGPSWMSGICWNYLRHHIQMTIAKIFYLSVCSGLCLELEDIVIFNLNHMVFLNDRLHCPPQCIHHRRTVCEFCWAPEYSYQM